MYFFCFQSKEIVSNLKRCFQSNLFPMYVSNLHITYGPYGMAHTKYKNGAKTKLSRLKVMPKKNNC